ncbi:hypothetical protein [Peptostreptococcus stomatis]|uniref:hypothetical protein n=1 Tax=Peptostreptococcus stomatis TaxID=341694 RepID=UPI0028E4D3EB|nr:hypothetical protein [Peptostreptococcus stomatis]
MRAIIINWNQVEWETYKAFLLKIPKSKYKMWIPKSHTQTTRNGKQIRVLLHDNFDYKVFKENKIERKEKIYDADGILELFGYEIESDYDDFDPRELYDKE